MLRVAIQLLLDSSESFKNLLMKLMLPLLLMKLELVAGPVEPGSGRTKRVPIMSLLERELKLLVISQENKTIQVILLLEDQDSDFSN